MVVSTRDLAVYAAIVGTLDGAYSVYRGVILDRARVVVRAVQAELIDPATNIRRPVFSINVSNRGRRSVYISAVARVTSTWTGMHEMSADIARELAQKPRVEESQSLTFTHGHAGGYAHGDLPTRRWFVQDGAGRIHPLRERYRQRAERVVLWPIRLVLRGRRSP